MSRAMAGAHKAPSNMQISVNESMIVSKNKSRLSAGSCNACPTHSQSQAHDTVTEVELRGLKFRLCCDCAKQLKEAL
jgi:hypothetical protein